MGYKLANHYRIKGALGSTLVRIKFPSMENQYAFYFLQYKYRQINSRVKGSGTPHVDPVLLWNYEIPIPPLNEQHRIVAKIEELFSELDKGVESLKTARAKNNTKSPIFSRRRFLSLMRRKPASFRNFRRLMRFANRF